MPDAASKMILRIMVAPLILLASVVTALSFPLKACELANPLVRTRTPHIQRRDLLNSLAVVGIPILVLKPARAELVGEGEQRMVLRQKPTAPVGALLPAIQQRLLLEAALKLVSSSWDESSKQQLQSILPPLDEQSSKLGTKQDVRVLKRYNPAKILRGDLTRAAMNVYTTNLNYNNLLSNPNDAYSVTDPKWKKSYIRANDGLPDIQKVIGADLDFAFSPAISARILVAIMPDICPTASHLCKRTELSFLSLLSMGGGASKEVTAPSE